MFLPPEAFGQSGAEWGDDEEGGLELASASQWDIAVRYHEFKGRPGMSHLARSLRRLSAEAIMERAQAILGSVVHPVIPMLETWDALPSDAMQPDIDIEETLEGSPWLLSTSHPSAQDIVMSYLIKKKQPIVLTVDTSLSMTGEKLALTAVALAVVLLQFPEDPIGIVAFENSAQVLKRPTERISIQELVERFLDVPAQGYTHLEDGLKGALSLAREARTSGGGRPCPTVLLTDGKYTAGRDPAYLAPRFSQLVLLKMGEERASLQLCKEMSRLGHGALFEVAELEDLPGAMYGIVKDLLRGRASA